MPREKDFAWAYCEKIPGSTKLLCKFCREHCSGGIYRFKFHIAKLPGHDISPCKAIPEDVRHQASLAIDCMNESKMKKARVNMEMGNAAGVGGQSSNTPISPPSVESMMPPPHIPNMPQVPQPPPIPTNLSTGGGNIHTYFAPRTQPGAQPTLNGTGWKKNVHKQARKAIANFWYYSDIPFNCARSPYWQSMIDAVAVAGPGFKAPTSESLRTDMLLESVDDLNLVLGEFRTSWAETGCTIMSDGWTDRRNRTLINFLVSCPKGTMFLKSVDASDKVKSAQLICEMMEEIVQEVGEENIVQIITDNAANYMSAGRLFEARHPTIFWSSCAAHCIDLMLEDIGKLQWIQEVVEKAKSITKFIYNHTNVLSTMRTYTEGKELVRPGVTRFATNFISLQSVVEQKVNLKRMFLGPKWMASRHGRSLEGIEIVALVFNDGFWRDAEEIIAVTEPLVKVLRYLISNFLNLFNVHQFNLNSNFKLFYMLIKFKL